MYGGDPIGDYGGGPASTGDTYYPGQPIPADCAHDIAGAATALLTGIGGAITSGALTNPAVVGAYDAWAAGSVELIVAAGIIIGALPFELIASLALITVGTLAALIYGLTCYTANA